MNNEIDKIDGMIKIKGKCGYEIIGGCKELRKYKHTLEEIKEIAESKLCCCSDDYCDLQRKSGECNDSEPCNSYLLRQIGKIISEVENV